MANPDGAADMNKVEAAYEKVRCEKLDKILRSIELSKMMGGSTLGDQLKWAATEIIRLRQELQIMRVIAGVDDATTEDRET
jgi:hypothetical protein